MVELRLPLTPDGDPRDPANRTHVRERFVRENHARDPADVTPTQIPHPTIQGRIPDFIPVDTRRKLRELILSSKNFWKTLQIFRSRSPRSVFDFGKADSHPRFR
jgi:hypothetical protein